MTAAGYEWSPDTVPIRFMGRDYLLSVSGPDLGLRGGGGETSVGSANPDAFAERILILHYLAMARGTPVLASDATSIPEVCRGAAVLVDPTDDDAIVEGLVSLLTDHGLRERLVDAGYVRAGEYNVQRTGEALLGALRSVDSRQPSPGGRLG